MRGRLRGGDSVERWSSHRKMIKTTAATGGYEMGGNKTSCSSDVRKHDEMGGRGQVEKKRVEGGIVSVRLR